MNDRYLYRAKRTDNGEWIIGFYHWTNWRNPQTKEIVNTTHYILPIDYQDGYHIDPSTICQCTGLRDKNGKLIWENDIVKRYTSSGDEWRISKIVWADYSLNIGWCIEDVKSLTRTSSRLFSVGFDVNDTKKCEVIGNIFDNQELLEVGE